MNKLIEIWKANKWGYLTAGIVVTFGCLFFYVQNQAPLQITLPLGWIGLGFFMFTFGLFLGGDE